MRECRWVARELCSVLPVDDSHSVAKEEPQQVETKKSQRPIEVHNYPRKANTLEEHIQNRKKIYFFFM